MDIPYLRTGLAFKYNGRRYMLSHRAVPKEGELYLNNPVRHIKDGHRLVPCIGTGYCENEHWILSKDNCFGLTPDAIAACEFETEKEYYSSITVMKEPFAPPIVQTVDAEAEAMPEFTALEKLPSNQSEETTMKLQTIVTQTLVNGLNVDGMTRQQLIELIMNTEKEVESLKSVKVESVSIAKDIKSLNALIKKAAALLDKKKEG